MGEPKRILVLASSCCFLMSGCYSSNLSVDAAGPTTVARTVVLREEFRQGQTVRIGGTELRAVRSDGTQAEIRESIDPISRMRNRQQRIVLFPDGRKVIFQDSLRTKTTFLHDKASWRAELTGRQRDPSADCMKTLDGTNASVSGEVLVKKEAADGLETIHTHVTSGHTMDLWYAPKLGCEIVKQVVLMRDGSGKEIGVSTKVLDSYVLGEPEETHFSDPAGYAEVKPSEAAARLMEQMKGSRPTAPTPDLVELDRQYDAGRK